MSSANRPKTARGAAWAWQGTYARNHPLSQCRDLRAPDADETPLSRDEILIGMRDGVIGRGPHARSRIFADVVVVEHRRVEVINFPESEYAQ